MSIYISPISGDMKSIIENLLPTSGYCIFIDIVGSTQMKEKSTKNWILAIYNTFINNLTYLHRYWPPLKSLGDELMFYIPEFRIKNNQENDLIIFSDLINLLTDKKLVDDYDLYFRDIKIAACYCKDAYDITFIEGKDDIYGKDIDLTARLASIVDCGELIINKEFYDRISGDYSVTGNKEQFSEFEKLVGPWPQKFKGFKESIDVYKVKIY
ncbi:MAG: hypothetical protein KAW56_00815 [Candidatus Marinimicrobia bacterium]|nr:hypothetical protein [Candidatus Neomarinimicrobiota bacterium]